MLIGGKILEISKCLKIKSILYRRSLLLHKNYAVMNRTPFVGLRKTPSLPDASILQASGNLISAEFARYCCYC